MASTWAISRSLRARSSAFWALSTSLARWETWNSVRFQASRCLRASLRLDEPHKLPQPRPQILQRQLVEVPLQVALQRRPQVRWHRRSLL